MKVSRVLKICSVVLVLAASTAMARSKSLSNLVSQAVGHGESPTYTVNAQVYFSPHGGATDAIVREIGKARSEILVLAYSFTSKPIAAALVDAKRRGVNVVAVLDKSQRTEKYSGATFLANAGIPVYIDSVHAIQHNKVLIYDRHTVSTGSFNLTSSAEDRNGENHLIITGNEQFVARYIEDFEKHRGHSESYR